MGLALSSLCRSRIVCATFVGWSTILLNACPRPNVPPSPNEISAVDGDVVSTDNGDLGHETPTCNRTCSVHATCNEQGQCACKDGFIGNGIICKSHLTYLATIPGGQVSLSSDATNFTVNLGISATTVAINAIASGEPPIFFDGKLVASGLPSVATPTDYGTSVHSVVLGEGTEAVIYSLKINRKLKGQEAYIKPDKAHISHGFGVVALQGDTLVVGAPQEGTTTTKGYIDQFYGAAYVFDRDETTGWKQTAHLLAPDPQVYNFFGYALALSGDTLVISAPGDYSEAAGGPHSYFNQVGVDFSGKVYVYRWIGGVWKLEAKLTDPYPNDQDGFGNSVALHKDTLIVGSSWEGSTLVGNNLPFSGGAYVFGRQGSLWQLQSRLAPQHPDAYDRFGYAVAVHGDTVAVGAVGESSAATGVNGDGADNSNPGSGAVYVFSRFGSLWKLTAYVKNPQLVTGGEPVQFRAEFKSPNLFFPYGHSFGAAVALSGVRLAIGGPGSPGPYVASGVSIFVKSGPSWVVEATLAGSNTDKDDYFGSALALDGEKLVVGAIDEGSQGTGLDGDQEKKKGFVIGAAYLFERNTGTWHQRAYIKPPVQMQYFTGGGVGLSGDRVAVGATAESSCSIGINGDPLNYGDNSADYWTSACADSGAVYVFH